MKFSFAIVLFLSLLSIFGWGVLYVSSLERRPWKPPHLMTYMNGEEVIQLRIESPNVLTIRVVIKGKVVAERFLRRDELEDSQ